jgi:hypothetical protein
MRLPSMPALLLRRIKLLLWLGALLCAGASQAQRVAYYTAWPEVVPVLSPDPVLGDKKVWEHWVYTEAFAKRFKGFAPEAADPQLRGGIQAMVFRAYRRNFWNKLVPDYPDQYACDLDVYFDNSIQLERDERKPIPPNWERYPKEIAASYRSLEAVSEADQNSLASSRPATHHVKTFPLTFAAPIDGRFQKLYVYEFHSDLVAGLAMAALGSGSSTCQLLGPKEDGGGIWISLFGTRPFKKTDDPSLLGGVGGGVIRGYRETFDPGPNPEQGGYFRLTDAFHAAVLPKVTLAKSLNDCIRSKHGRLVQSKNTSDWDKQRLLKTCEAIEKQGIVYDFYSDRAGRYDVGF